MIFEIHHISNIAAKKAHRFHIFPRFLLKQKNTFFPAPPFAILLAMIMELTAFEKAGKGLNEEAFLLLLHVYNPIGGGGGKFLFYPFPPAFQHLQGYTPLY